MQFAARQDKNDKRMRKTSVARSKKRSLILAQREYYKEEYKKRNVVERFINVIKQCRRVATRYEKTARNFLAVVSFASIFVLIN